MKTKYSETETSQSQEQRKGSRHSHPLRTLGTGLIAGMMISGAAQGAYIDFDGTPDLTPVSMTFAQDVTFTVTNDALTYIYFVIDELFSAPDGDATGISSFASQLSFSINGGALFTTGRWVDNLNTSVNNITPSDSYFFNSDESFSLLTGDIVTLHAGTLTSSITPGSDFNLGATGEYTLFLADSSGNRISSDAIPEPASAMMLIFGIGVVVAAHRARHPAAHPR